MPRVPPIVSIDHLGRYPHAVLADVRWYLDGRSGRAAYEAGHLPGAVFVDLERDLTRHDLPATAGRHPLPTPEAFATAMSALGIGDDSVVFAYDDSGGVTAGRLVVMLRMIGREAAVLDGGLDAWGGELASGEGTVPEPLEFTPQQWPVDRLADADEAAALARRGDSVVLDARAFERFTGEVTLIDPRPGHIPGATSAPWSAVIDRSTGRFQTPAALRRYFQELGINGDTTVVAYCGSGVSACMNILAMEHADLAPARLYVGSWSGWSADPERHVEMGAGR